MHADVTVAADKPIRRPRPWYTQLWAQVMAAMVLGVLLGHFYPDLGVRLQPLGDAFIKAIRMLIAPIIFCTVVHGIARMADVARVGRVAIKALIYFEILTGHRAFNGQRLSARRRNECRPQPRRCLRRQFLRGADPKS